MNTAAERMDLTALCQWGERIGRELPDRAVVWLEGPLGAGKTTLARAIVAGRGVAEGATSPTYGLVHHYTGPRGDVYHVDCYRLAHPDQARDLDWETLAAANLLLIEWPERGGGWTLPPTARVRLQPDGADLRRLTLA
jgi:tRNA threonylcarbamoyladenosine biosynthesis protein TsaE